ncbi:PIG-L family deacetylase [Lacibacter sp. H375]|uniref:PIG-L deacetylase family protein n=1 Tax=Lacibacter sp. H375 TaxID=3133424 RepID=UPI0030C250FA
MKFLLALPILLCLIATIPGKKKSTNKNTILVIFPHSDDETAIAHVLARYAPGNKIQIIYTVNPPNDSIIPIRQKEGICSCEKIGIEKPIFLPNDRLDGRDGPREYFKRINALKTDLKKLIEQINPNIIITHGPEGESGHYEHRITGSIVTELILREGWYDKYPIYYFAEPTIKTNVEQLSGTGEVDGKYLNVAIKYSLEDENKSIESYKCHQSQLELIKDHIHIKLADTVNIAYFRKLHIDLQKRNDFFK